MSKKYAFVTTFVFLLILSGCGRNIQYYTHPASSNNAYIQGSRTDYNYVVTYPISVDGELIEDEAILARNRVRQETAMAPGKHNIGIRVIASPHKGTVNIDLIAKPGEHYTVEIANIGQKEGIIDKVLNSVTIWIVDSHGNPVTKKYTLGRHL
jgi:hypothetical protein